jgi:DNA polymerase III epsilon subunit-like protein
MNYKSFIVMDFETTSPDPYRTQPVQIAAVAIHSRKLEIIPGSEFQSLMKPIFDPEECERLGVDELQDGAVAVHGKTKEMLEKAPETEAVWKNFVEYVNQYNYKNNSFTAPICVGYNIKNFDNVITKRLCMSDPYNFGPVDKKFNTQGIFNPITSVDVYDMMFLLFENDKDVNSLSADNLIRKHMGYSKGQAHDAMGDVIMTAELFIRTQKMFRALAGKKKFKDSFKATGN